MRILLITTIGILAASGVFISFSQANGQSYYIPSWIKNTANWWSQGQVSDDDFINGIQYMIQKGVIQVSTSGQPSGNNSTIPSWVKSNARLWATGQVSSDEFAKGIQYMLQNKIMTASPNSANMVSYNANSLNNGIQNTMTSGSQVILSYDDLLSMAGNKYSDGNVPLGDGKYVTTGPKKGYIYLCGVPPMGQGAQSNGPWIHGNTWNFLEKLSVSGSVSWPNAIFSNTVSGNTRTLSGNGLPSHTTGTFPISPSDTVSEYDGNPNSISVQSYSDTLPASPTYSDTPYCMRGEVGIMLTGVPLFDGFDAELRDAPAHEAQDTCNGHPQNTGEYHYHGISSCFKDINETTVLGYALDGFPITGPKVAADKYLTTDDLDECHGITSEIIEDGITKTTYHYVMTYDFPYSASCFRGKPVQYMVISGGQSGQSGQPGTNQPGPNQPGSPPQEAINACNGKSSGSVCSFTSPRGDVISGTCRIPPSSSLACVPH